jgi:hypothetical protein
LFARIWPAVRRVNERATANLPEPAIGFVRWALQEMCRNFDTPKFDADGAQPAASGVA